jgi:DNA mismatch repair protein MutS
VLSYVEKTQIGERPALQRPSRENRGAALFIDAATRANLELTRTLSGEKQGSLIKAIDRTITGAGSRLLTERLMTPLTDPVKIADRQDSVAWFITQSAHVEGLREVFKRFPDMPRALQRISLNRGGPRDMGALLTGMSAALDVVASFSQNETLPHEIAEALKYADALPRELIEKLINALDDELPLLKRDGGFIKKGFNAELDELRSLRDESRRVIASLQAQYSEETEVKNLKIKHNNMLGYFIEVTANNAGALTDGDEAKARYIHRQTLANAMRFTTTELSELESKIANAAGKALQIELHLFDELTKKILSFADEINNAARAIAVLDVESALALLAEEQGYVRPKVDNSLAFDIKAGRHPVVEIMLRKNAENPFVANDCSIGANDNQGEGSIWLLTGPNMGGKSTFLRQNALIAIMAQMGSFVPAGAAHIGVVDRLFSRVGAADDLARGRSTFMVEMVETAAILNQAGDRSLVILDEIGRGTATFDGLSIAWATIENLHEVNKCRTLFATHYHELTALSEPLARLTNVTLKVKEWEGDVIFLHEVIAGAADRSYGIQVARLAGLPDAVIARARDVLDQLEEADLQSARTTLIDDLPLFSAVINNPKPQAKASPALEELNALNPDDLSPKEALEVLYKLKSLSE